MLRWLRRLFPSARSTRSQSRRQQRSWTPRLEELEARDQPSVVPAGFQDTLLVNGINTPTAMQFAPDGRLFVSEQPGKILIVKHGVLQQTPFLTVSTIPHIERGLEGFVLDPNFERNGFVYVYYTPAGSLFNRISRFTVSRSNPDQVDPNSERVLLDGIPAPTGFHVGGFMRFGSDGKLYVGIGDSNRRQLAQRLSSLNGKILRLDPANYPNVVPPDNPFVGRPGARPEIWAYGFRNPFSGDVIPGTNLLLVNDVGEDTWEDVKLVLRARRYGWPVFEGPTGAGFTAPLFTYNHHDARFKIHDAAITGGALYSHSQFPAEFQGGYFFADIEGGFIALLPAGSPTHALRFAQQVDEPINLEVGPNGQLYYLTSSGQIHEISFGSPQSSPGSLL